MKLLAEAARADELEQSDNPFAWFVLAHIKAVETKKDDRSRYSWKLRLVRNLFERGLSAPAIRSLFRLIDWVMTLPPELIRTFQQDLAEIEEREHMPYVTSIERLAKEDGLEEGLQRGREQGIEQGLKQGIRALLRVRFGDDGLKLVPEIEILTNCGLLETILEQASVVASPAELRHLWK